MISLRLAWSMLDLWRSFANSDEFIFEQALPVLSGGRPAATARLVWHANFGRRLADALDLDAERARTLTEAADWDALRSGLFIEPAFITAMRGGRLDGFWDELGGGFRRLAAWPARWRGEPAPGTLEGVGETLFDPEWYLAQSGPVESDPRAHYAAEGARLGYDPHPLFCTKWYVARHPAVVASGLDPLSHYLAEGANCDNAAFDTHPLVDLGAWARRSPRSRAGDREAPALLLFLRDGADDIGFHPHPLFDGEWYARRFGGDPNRSPIEDHLRRSRTTQPNRVFDTDWYLAREMPADASPALSPLQHYVQAWSDVPRSARGPNPRKLFDAAWYQATNPDIQVPALQHFLEYGEREGRPPHPLVDLDFHVRAHAADPLARERPLEHYLAHAAQPGVDPNPFFDSDWYAAERDLKGRSALEHFLDEGEAAGASPHPLWDEALYLQVNPDVAESVRRGAISTPFRHFASRGARELDAGKVRRFSFAWGDHMLDYDRHTYLADNPDVVQALNQGRARAPLEHLFTTGHEEARQGLRSIYGPRHRVRLIREEYGGRERGAPHLCLFAHYDRDGLIAPYVRTSVQALSGIGMDVVFITATADAEQLDSIRPFAIRVLIKNEVGRDFGSWRLALDILGLDCGRDYERVLFVNDSFYFPVRPIPDLVEKMRRTAYDIFALSDSRQDDVYHLQSYFLAFNRKAQEIVFPHFVDEFDRRYALHKYGQIREFEYGLTTFGQEAGLSVGALLSVDDVRELLIHDPRNAAWAPLVRFGLGGVNPSHHLFEFAIGQLGWPALKVELLRDNPLHIGGLKYVPGLIADGEVPYAQIRDHQLRVSRPPGARVTPVRPLPSHTEVVSHRRVPGSGPANAKRLVLFAHYDPQGVMDDHVLYQLRSLAQADCSIVLITSSSDAFELQKAAPFVREIIVKNEAGRDFGSWNLALELLQHELQSFDSVIWMNDSTYFPLFNLDPMFEEMDNRKPDFWGVVDSSNVTWHVMSWFWAFQRSAIRAGWLDWFQREYNSSHTKWAQIHNYEMRLPRLIRASGLRAEAYVPADQVAAGILAHHPNDPRADALRSGCFNMMHDTWKEAVVDHRCPSIKVELVRDNPLGIDLSKMLAVVGEHTTYDPELIRRHMLRLKCAHLPPPSRRSGSLRAAAVAAGNRDVVPSNEVYKERA